VILRNLIELGNKNNLKNQIKNFCELFKVYRFAQNLNIILCCDVKGRASGSTPKARVFRTYHHTLQ